MIHSVRARLALWHTAVLAVLLVAFAASGYAYLAHASLARIDALLVEATELFEGALGGAGDAAEDEPPPGSGDELPEPGAVREAASGFHLAEARVLVLDAAGRVVSASPADPHRADASPGRVVAALARRRADLPATFTLPGPEGGYRVHAEPYAYGDAPLRVVAVQPLAGRLEELEGLRAALAVVIPVALLLSWLGGWLLARRSLAPVMAMGEQAEHIGAGNLHERLPVPDPHDELGRLARVFNDLLARLEAAFEQQRRFMADAAHELRTPVAVLRGESDVALARDDRSAEEYRESLEVVRGEGRRLSRVVDDLFLLARADAGEQPLRPEYLYLDDLVDAGVRAVRSLAAEREIQISVDALPDAPFRGDEAHLLRLLVNLLDNAIKYSPAGATVRVVLERDPSGYRLSVRDPGMPIPAGVREQVFSRFYRAPSSAAAEVQGAGLGLPIARWAAEAHGGTLTLAPADGAGNEFVVRLPAPGAGAVGAKGLSAP